VKSRSRVQRECLVRRHKEWFQASYAEEKTLDGSAHFSVRISVIEPLVLMEIIHNPSEMIGHGRIRESSVRVLIVRELIVHDLTAGRSVREIRPRNNRVMRDVGGGGVSQPQFVAVNELWSIRETVPCEEKPLFSTVPLL
jgi:hypothetical protein